MKIYYFYNKSFVDVKNYFVDSMKDNFELCPINLDEKFNIGHWSLGGRDDEKIALWIFKTEQIIKAIEENFSEENIIIFSDTDIQFFRPIIPTIEKHMIGNDMAFQREFQNSVNVNIGFMSIRCNQNSLSFWQNVLNMISHTACWDQVIVNSILFCYMQKEENADDSVVDVYKNIFSKKRKIHKSVVNYFNKTGRRLVFDCFDEDVELVRNCVLFWSLLPNKITASSHNNIPEDIELHHVNLEGGNFEVKLDAMKRIAEKVKQR